MAIIDVIQKKLNVQPTGIPTVVRLSQNENGRELIFDVENCEIPAGSTVTLEGTKPDGTVYSLVGSITDNTTTFFEDIQMTAVGGEWDAKVIIVNSGDTVATGRIKFIIDPDTVDPDAVPSDSQLDGLVAQAQEYAEYAKGAAYGAPYVASTVAQMTDHDHVYVYTGSEAGYTAGNWYYWNGGAWVSGGTYNSVAVTTDKTLAVSDMAADAKVTGDYLEDTTGAKRINFTTGAYINTKTTVGSAVSLSPVASATHSYAIEDCAEGDVFWIEARGTVPAMAYAFINSSGNLIERCEEATRIIGYVVAPANAAKLVINSYLDGDTRNSYAGTKLAKLTPLATTLTNGYYIHYNTGGTSSASARSVTGYIEVEPDTPYYVSFVYLNGNASICEYDPQKNYLRYLAYSSAYSGMVIRTSPDCGYLRMSGIKDMPMLIAKLSDVATNAENIEALTPTHSNYSYSGNPLHMVGTSSKGMDASVSGSDGNTTVTCCGKNIFDIPTDKTITRNSVTFTYDSTAKSIRVQSTGAAATTVSGESGTVNGTTALYDYKFRFKSSRFVTASGNCSQFIDYAPPVYMQFFSSTTSIEADNGQGFTRYVTGGSEYAVRICVLAGWAGDVTFYPQIEFGAYPTPFEPYNGSTVTAANIRTLKPHAGVTNMFTNDDSTLNITAKLLNDTDKLPGTNTVADKLTDLNPNISTPYARMNSQGGQICFIDDDTTSLALVQRYHGLFSGLDAVGNYAVMPFRLDSDPDLVSELLDYEKEGFGMLYHVNYQQGADTEYFLPDPAKRDMAQAEDNFVTGLRKMQGYGFVNYRYWVSPYGVNDYDMQRLAKRHGMRCLISTGNNSSINRSNANRWNIPRYGFSPSEDNTPFLKEALDNCIINKGLMVVTTHVNTWGNDTSIDARFITFVQYCITQGAKVVSFPEGFETKLPMFLLNELF